METLISFKNDDTGITIHIPADLLVHVATFHPSGKVVVVDEKEFVQRVAITLSHFGGDEQNHSGFTKLIDDCIEDVANYDATCAYFETGDDED